MRLRTALGIDGRLIGITGFALVAFSLAAGRAAHAQEQDRVPSANGEGMDTHLFRPAIDSKGFFSVNGTDIIAANDLSFGMVLDYGRSILRTNPDRVAEDGAQGAGDKALVPHAFNGTFGLNYGLANWAVVGVQVPVVLMSGDAVNDIGATGSTYDADQLNVQALGHVALHGKLRLLRVERGFGVALAAQAGVPVAGAERQLASDPGFWYWPRLILEKDLGESRWFKMAVNGGYRGHTGENPSFGLDSAGRTQLEEGELTYGNLATFGLGLSVRALDAVDLVAETYGSYLLEDAAAKKQKLSQEIVGGIKLFIERNSYLMLGAGSRAFSTGFEAAKTRMILGFVFEPSIGDRDGDGLKDDVDLCPDEPEDFDHFEDGDGCPELDNDKDGILDKHDRCPNVPEDIDQDEDEDGCPEARELDSDGDGIIDAKDKCPNKPEDRDGYQDEDGCPDLDNDGDGIPDTRDRCPLDKEDKDGFEDEDGCPEPDNDRDQIPDVDDRCPNDPENYNGVEDEDGCPEKGTVIVGDDGLVLLQQIQFETASAAIRPESKELLDEIATILQDHSEFGVIEVAGHADERGGDTYNLNLTKARARSVVHALVGRGVAARRLVSQGYGEYCPLDAQSTPEAWEKNRRVDFKIVKENGAVKQVERGCRAARSAGVEPPPIE